MNDSKEAKYRLSTLQRNQLIIVNKANYHLLRRYTRVKGTPPVHCGISYDEETDASSKHQSYLNSVSSHTQRA